MWLRSAKAKALKMSPDPLMPSYVELIKYWAKNEQLIKRVFIFGSRTRGNYSGSSDIDIAIELSFSEPNTNLANFLFEQDRWGSDLKKLINLEVDVQLLEVNNKNSIIFRGVSDNSILAYQQSAEA
jgi:predicted nucleotidyltransferase